MGGRHRQLDRLLAECDVAVVSAPLNEQTEGMIGAQQLRALGPDGVLINVGRGPLVQERALYDALAGGVIRAAAIDVWYRYPVERRRQRAERTAVRGAAERVDDAALVGRHAGHVHRPRRRHRGEHRQAAARSPQNVVVRYTAVERRAGSDVRCQINGSGWSGLTAGRA